MRRAAPRSARLAALLAVAVGLGITGHAAIAHAMPSGTSIAAAIAVLAALAWRPLGRELGGPAIAALVLSGQVALHVVAVATHAGSAPTLGPSGLVCIVGGHHGEAASARDAVAMVAVHLLASVACAWWLRQGERALWRGVRRIAAAVRRLIAPPAPRLGDHRTAEVRWAGLAPRIGRGGTLADGWSRRGPPARGSLVAPR